MTTEQWARLVGAVLVTCTALSGAWWTVTRADEVMRNADRVPVLEQGHHAQETRISDLEGDAARTAQALEKVAQAQDKSAQRELEQTALMQQILVEVRRGRN